MKKTWLLFISYSESYDTTIFNFEAEDKNEALQIVSEKVNKDAEVYSTVYHPEFCGYGIKAAITDGVNHAVYTAQPLKALVTPFKNSGGLDKLYSLLEHILSCTPCMDDCSDEENMVYSKMAELKDALVDAGYDK